MRIGELADIVGVSPRALRDRIQQLLATSGVDEFSDEDPMDSPEIFQQLRHLGAAGQAYRTDQARVMELLIQRMTAGPQVSEESQGDDKTT